MGKDEPKSLAELKVRDIVTYIWIWGNSSRYEKTETNPRHIWAISYSQDIAVEFRETGPSKSLWEVIAKYRWVEK